MPVQTMSRSCDGPVPFYTSIFGREPELNRLPDSAEPASLSSCDSRMSSNQSSPDRSISSSQGEHRYIHRPRTSISTLASESPECSPSATISPTDSSVTSEITPGTSPDTPASMHSLSFLALRAPREAQGEAIGNPDSDFYRPAPPAKKARNLKNLAVNTSNALAPPRKATTASFPIEVSPLNNSPTISASPAFVKPLAAPKRKPSNLGLTLMTPATGSFPTLPFQQQPLPQVPPTPSLPSLTRPAILRHFQSSPAVPTFASARLSDRSIGVPHHPLRRSIPFSGDDVPFERDEHELQDTRNFEESESRGESPNAYPDGPVCIYEPYIYLYSEPTAEVASSFDVIFNVASEVKNPFLDAEPSAPSPLAQSTSLPASSTRVAHTENGADSSFHIGLESTKITASSDVRELSPAGNTQSKPSASLPIYRHIPWEHTTDIVPDLHNLVREVDEYTKKGNKILIHCQCGVSRSASLIVAYGLYKNSALSVQEAYDAVKRKSQWIGPNMNLIMQLQEFRSALLKGMRSSGLGRSPYQLPSQTERRPLTASNNDVIIPQTAPLQADGRYEEEVGPDTPIPISPGPSSAPSEFNRLASEFDGHHPQPLSTSREVGEAFSKDKDLHPPGLNIRTTFEEPIRAIIAHEDDISPKPKSIAPIEMGPEESALRSTEFAMTTILPTNNDDMFGLSSPRPTTFATALPHRQLHGDTAPEIRALSHPDPEKADSPNQDSDVTPTSTSPPFSNSVQGASLSSAPRTLNTTEPNLDNVLMSPRAFEFTTSPFHDALNVHEPPQPRTVTQPADDDPRSPPQKGTSPVMRNIFEVL